VAEFPIFMGVWTSATSPINTNWPYYAWVGPVIAITAAISIVITAAYILRIIRKVFFGPVPAEFEGHITEISSLDKVALVVLASVLILLGVFPSLMVPLVESGVDNILRLFGGA